MTPERVESSMITSSQYLERLHSMKHNVYMFGKKVEVPVDHPQLRTNFNAISIAYDMPLDSKYQDLMSIVSPVTGKRISLFNHPCQSNEELLRKVDMIRTLVSESGCPCIGRCVGSDAMSTIGITSFELDKEFGTNYYQRFIDYMKYFQENDLTAAGAVTDAKGDRSLRPHEQVDPDLYVHVVEKRRDGIVVRGAKTSITGVAVCDEILVIPGRGLTEKDAEYAVAFAIPADAEGIRLITIAKAPTRETTMEFPVSRRFAFSDSMVVFDNVFVPWERVFLCGEWQFGGGMGSLFGDFHRLSHCGCIPGRGDLMIGAASLIAKCNGIRDKGHVVSKLVDLITTIETVYACGVTAAVKGFKTPSGFYQPATIYSNTGKLIESENTLSMVTPVVDLCGGMLLTKPSEADYLSPDTREDIIKYLRGAVEAEDRIRVLDLIADLTITRWGASMSATEVMGAGSPEAQRRAIHSNYDFEKREALARRIAGVTNKI